MFRHGARSFATSAKRLAVAAAAEPTQHLIAVSKAQGIAKGLTGGMRATYLYHFKTTKRRL
jgi:cysteine synthase A